ncbi:hypothetical protein BJ138DRAFT_925442 [Hygrophoropsis aurantiaca]|uniref:Uncharacterized protein n=1 Tax=Hygrophoropsis aurantiaca TaxID=72124 RepID=A0ACB8ADR1_9AGAM|nr:hypothetical protein BJ138DRAFT_925442 [Hygrophoropsis aurantiaca]
MAEPDPGTLTRTIGALLIGFTFSIALFGVTSAQCYFFLRRNIQDGTKFRLIIYTLWSLEIVQFVMITHTLYYYTVARHGFTDILGKPAWTLLAQNIPTYLIIGIVQYVWIMRIWTLSRSSFRSWIAAGMFSIILAYWGICTYVVTQRITEPQWANLTRDWGTLSWIALLATNDIIATFLLCFTLHSSRNGVRVTDTIITVLMAYALNTGLLTCLISIATLFLIVFTPFEFYYAALYVVFVRLYVNSLLAMLNWRRGKIRTRRMRADRLEAAFEMSSLPWGDVVESITEEPRPEPADV